MTSRSDPATSTARRNPHPLDEVFPLWLADHQRAPLRSTTTSEHYNGMVAALRLHPHRSDIDTADQWRCGVCRPRLGAVTQVQRTVRTRKGAIKTGVRRLPRQRAPLRRAPPVDHSGPGCDVHLPRAPAAHRQHSPQPSAPSHDAAEAPHPTGGRDRGPWTASSSCSSPPPACAPADVPPSNPLR